jgi:hypothetical protein
MQQLARSNLAARPGAAPPNGLAMAFGPGMSCESMAFRAAPAAS